MTAHTDDDPHATPPAEGQAPPAGAAEDPQAGGAEASPGWRRWLPRRRPPAAAGPAAPGDEAGPGPDGAGDEAPQPTEVIAPPPQVEGPGRLRRRRRKLLTRREEAVYHLGGLAFELYRRDMLGEEVMRRRAGEVALLDDTVRDIDARLGELDRERRERRRRAAPDAAAGNCLDCRAPFRAEARFCWQCGAQLVPSADGDEQVTAVISSRPEPGGADAGRDGGA
jgi:hypothetical protein